MIPFQGPVWRVMDAAYAADPLAPVYGREGRFHHSGEVAIYTSLSPRGVAVAIKRYVKPEILRGF